MGRIRQVVAATTAAVVALLGVSCSSDDEEEATPTTAEDTTTTTVLTDEEFQARTDEFVEGIQEAGTDFCAVVEAGSASLDAEATEPDRVRSAVDVYVIVLETLAATEPVDEANSASLLATAEQLRAAAEADGYTVGFLTSPAATDILASEQFSAALQQYQLRAAEECTPGGAAEVPLEGEQP